MKEAQFYVPLTDGVVQCHLCAHRCRISAGKRGLCGVRENRDGILYSLNYGRLVAQNVDPIEKKPLYHFFPGSRSYSIATMGCNFRCRFCQNADIAQTPHDSEIVLGDEVEPKRVVKQARGSRCTSISYTYVEPTIFMEYAIDVARGARSEGIQNVFVTNGYMTREALESLLPHLDAANIDLKAFNDDFYIKQCGARRMPVLETIERMKNAGIWVEVTTLLIPGLNDAPKELLDLAGFLVGLSPDIPWHVTAFHPAHRMTDRPATPVAVLRKAREIGLEAGLRYVYTGNIPGDRGENTYCHICGGLLIQRYGYSLEKMSILQGGCPICGEPLAGVGIP